MKRRSFLAATGAAAGASALGGRRAGAVTELRMGTPFVNGSNLHQAMQRFAAEIEKASGGSYRVLVYTDSQLGDIQQLMSGMQLGTVDMAYLGVGNGAALRGGAPLNVANTPYLFNSKDAAHRMLNSEIFAPFYEDLAAQAGVRAFAVAGARSNRAVQTTKGPIERPADIKGFRMRIPPVDMFRGAFEALGVKVVPMGLSDVYLALSRDQIDGQDNGFDLSLAFKWHEIAKYWSATAHCYEVACWYMSERRWQQLSIDERDMFKTAAMTGGAVATELGNEIDRNGIATVKAAGVTYVEPDVAAFKALMHPVYRQYEGKIWPEGLVDRIQKAQGA